jgi:hypothetical protein
VRSPHDPETNWEEFLGFGVNEMQAEQIVQNGALKIVRLPPISLMDQRNISLVGRIINQAYPQSNIVFRLPSDIYFETDLDQREIMPAIYSKKYEASRRRAPLDVGFKSGYLHIGVHIRRQGNRPNLSPCLNETHPEWKWRWISDGYYINALEDLLPLIDRPFQVHIFSDGTEEELYAFNGRPNCIFHLHEDPRWVFHAMVCADILLSSSSAFSICAGKISSGLKLIGRGFNHSRLFIPETSHWALIEQDGHLSDHARIQVQEKCRSTSAHCLTALDAYQNRTRSNTL